MDERMVKALRTSERNIVNDINDDSKKRREADARIQKEISKSLGFDIQMPIENHKKFREETHNKYV